MTPASSSPFTLRSSLNRAFTLVEVMVGMSIGLLIMGAVCMIIVMSARTITKITMLDDATTNTRKLQEHINKELSAAVSQTTPIRIVPTYSDIGTSGRAGCITYRTQIGSFATVPATTLASSSDITLACPSDVNVEVGDYVMIDSPNLGSGAVVASVSDSRSPGTAGNVSVTLTTSISAATITSNKSDVAANTLATIQRPRKYATFVRTDNSALSELRYYESTADTSYVVLSNNIDSATRFLFVQTPADPSGGFATEPAINWQITYLNADTATYLPGSVPTYYKTNYSEGVIMPKSGNPLSTNSYAGITTSKSTTSTTTSSTTSSSTTSSTTSKSTTSSTTSKSTTSSTTSTSTTSTTSSSTTSKSTTSTTSSSTTSTSTTKSTTTSTTSKSTTSTTSTSTTTSSTTSTSTTTSKSTTTSSTTSKSTTSTKSTTTTSIPTTTSSTTSSTSIPTTSIPLDG